MWVKALKTNIDTLFWKICCHYVYVDKVHHLFKCFFFANLNYRRRVKERRTSMTKYVFINFHPTCKLILFSSFVKLNAEIGLLFLVEYADLFLILFIQGNLQAETFVKVTLQTNIHRWLELPRESVLLLH